MKTFCFCCIAAMFSLASALQAAPAPEATDLWTPVSSQIDLGGDFLFYMDTEDEPEQFAEFLNQAILFAGQLHPAARSIPPAAPQLFDALGFSSVDAIGASAKKLEDGRYRNRIYLHAPQGLKGLMQTFGSMEDLRGFDAAHLAPENALAVWDFQVSVVRVRDTLIEAARNVAGDAGVNMLNNALNQPLEPGHELTYNMLIERLGNTQIQGWALRGEESAEASAMPALAFACSIANAGWVAGLLEEAAANDPSLTVVESQGERKLVQMNLAGPEFSEIPTESSQVLIFSETAEGPLLIASGREDIESFQKAPERSLADTEAFKQAMAGLPEQGVGFSYVSSEYHQMWLKFYRQQMEAASGMPMPGFVNDLTDILWGHSEASVLAPSKTGMLSIGNQNLSLKTVTFAVPMAITGLGAAMAIPAFQKVREGSQTAMIQNNLRMIANGAEMYFIETGESSVTVSQLIEGAYFDPIEPVAGESYEMSIELGFESLSVETADGQIVTYSYY